MFPISFLKWGWKNPTTFDDSIYPTQEKTRQVNNLHNVLEAANLIEWIYLSDMRYRSVNFSKPMIFSKPKESSEFHITPKNSESLSIELEIRKDGLLLEGSFPYVV